MVMLIDELHERVKKLECDNERFKYIIAKQEGKEWTGETCGSCSHPYWSAEDLEGICHHVHSNQIRRDRKACRYWRKKK